MLPAWIPQDPFYRRCITLATISKAEQERYGALLVLDDKVIGEGYNRRPVKGEPINMGLVNHAETNALNSALLQGIDVTGASLYVAGYFADIGVLNIRPGPIFTCVKCPPLIERYPITALHVPAYDGWAAIPIAEVRTNAERFHAITPGDSNYEKRLVVGNSGIPLEAVLQEDF